MKDIKCSKCGDPKPLSEFYKDKQKTSGYRPECKECGKEVSDNYERDREKTNWNNIKWKTGITKDQYLIMLKDQDNTCAICKRPREDFNINFSIDHDHETLLIRGLLCSSCNKGLGHFYDDINLLKNAIEYLTNNLSHSNKIEYGYKKNKR